jgi:hypothetical protein
MKNYKKLILPSVKTEDEIYEIINHRIILLYIVLSRFDGDPSTIELPINFIIKYSAEITKIKEDVIKENIPKHDYIFWRKVADLNQVDGLMWCIDDGGDSGEKYGYLCIEGDDWQTNNYDFDEFDAIEEAWNVIQTLPKLKIKGKR